MASDTPQTTATSTPVAVPLEVRDKVRIRFRKSGELRLLSHHDLMRAFERMLRRASLPFRNSQGFHPKPRLVFALSLPLGVIGCEEVVEVELSQILSLDDLQQRLTAQCPPGLELLSFRRLEPRAGAQVRGFTYRIALPSERVAAVEERIRDVLAATECWAERTRPPARRVNLRPFFRDLRITHAPSDGALSDSALSEPRPLGSVGAQPLGAQPLPNGRGSERASGSVGAQPLPNGRGSERASGSVGAQPLPNGRGSERASGSVGAQPLPNGRGSERPLTYSLEIDLFLTPQGTARPEEVLTVLGVNDLLDAGAVLERARLELTDEILSPPSAEGIA